MICRTAKERPRRLNALRLFFISAYPQALIFDADFLHLNYKNKSNERNYKNDR